MSETETQAERISRMGPQLPLAAGICLFFLLACIAVTVCGTSHRAYSRVRVARAVAESRDALAVWEGAQVRGRVLLLFDGKLNADSSRDAGLTNDNYVDAAITRNLVRRVIHVVPAGRWEEASGNLLVTGVVSYSGGVFSTTVDGAPLSVATLATMPKAGEQALIHVNGESFTGREREEIAGLLRAGAVRADIVTVVGNSGAGPFRGLADDLDRQ